MSSWIHDLVRERDSATLAEFFANPENREIVDDIDEYERTPLIVAFDCESPSREVIQVLLDAGATPNVWIFKDIEDPELALEFIRAGADPIDLNRKAWWGILGISDGGPIRQITKEQFDAGRRPHFGRSNPEEIFDPFKLAMIQCWWGPDGAREVLGGGYAKSLEEKVDLLRPLSWFKPAPPDPVWCNAHSGQTTTFLPDGRIILIGGEYGDGYDADFCIYNDVIVIEPDKSIRIFTYPRDVFPPTDFHSATLAGNEIIVLGSMGDSRDRRVGETPMFALNTGDYSIRPVMTTGEKPGWVHNHRARKIDNALVVTGGRVWAEGNRMRDLKGVFELDLDTMVWKRFNGL